MIIKPKDFNGKKYNRVFIFGCSFTNYIWPTWANVLHFETNPGTLAYNYGKTGGGNLFILSTLMAAHQKHRFTKGDIILLMWSTFCREDRYIAHGWETPGNLWTQEFYDAKFLRKYACSKGYTVRDLALISAGTKVMESFECDALPFLSVPPDWDKKYAVNMHEFDEVVHLYKDVIDSYPQVMYESVKDGTGGWVNGHHYHWPGVGGSTEHKLFADYHPNTKMYMKYLMDVGVNISQETQNKVQQYMSELQGLNHSDTIRMWSDNIYQGLGNYFWHSHLI